MKSIFTAVSMIAAIVMFILAMMLFTSNIGVLPPGVMQSSEIPYNHEYGGDAYTGIQNAAAATARNVAQTNELIVQMVQESVKSDRQMYELERMGFGAVALATGFAFLLVSLYSNGQYRKERAAEEAKRVLPSFYPTPTPTPAPAPTSTPSAPAGVMKDGWLCTCGKMNPQYMSSCTCGKTAREIREMNKPQ